MQNDDKPAPRFFPQGNNHAAQQRDTGEIKIFVPARFDDYGLKPTVFRVYCHIARRDGNDGAWPAIANIARVCRIHPQTVRKALKFLTAHGFLTRTPRRGQTTLYRLTPPSAWQPPDTR
jgi:DNA-binding MarR family transcriptional regulator